MGTEKKPGERRRRLSWWIGLAIVAVYVGWIIAPYLRSVIVRDAAVTSWINVATSPIRGNVDAHRPEPGRRVGPDGRLMTVRDDHADRSRVELGEAEVTFAEARVRQLAAYLARVERLDAERQAVDQQYGQTYRASVAIEADRTRQELALLTQQRDLAQVSAARAATLAQKGHASRSDAEDAEARAIEINRQWQEHQKTLEEDQLRERAADGGVFLATDGTDPDWAYRGRDALQLEVARTETALAGAKAALGKAQAAAAAAGKAYERATAGIVTVPPGSLVWSVMVGAGAAVDVGGPVAEWLDCNVMLIDVPVADVQLALLHQGMRADVILEGERQVRRGTVLMTRGASATLGSADLAAIAKGRAPGVGQVILTLDHTREDADRCPIGHAAHVEFPEVGLLDILRVRLRL
jgi:multidrug resistance efflux pump